MKLAMLKVIAIINMCIILSLSRQFPFINTWIVTNHLCLISYLNIRRQFKKNIAIRNHPLQSVWHGFCSKNLIKWKSYVPASNKNKLSICSLRRRWCSLSIIIQQLLILMTFTSWLCRMDCLWKLWIHYA
jgi:hypothetical protein